MIDSEAPIIPGKSAAGILLGSSIELIREDLTAKFVSSVISSPWRSNDLQLFQSDKVDLWVKGGRVVQIGVHGSYRGKILGETGIGSTIAELESSLGRCVEDEEDNLVIENIGGLSLEIDGDSTALENSSFKRHRIKKIFVFQEDRDD